MPTDAQIASAAGLALDPNANAVKQGRRSPLDVMNQAAQTAAQAPAAPVGAPEAGGGTPPSIAALHAQDPDGLAQAAQKLAPSNTGSKYLDRMVDAGKTRVN